MRLIHRIKMPRDCLWGASRGASREPQRFGMFFRAALLPAAARAPSLTFRGKKCTSVSGGRLTCPPSKLSSPTSRRRGFLSRGASFFASHASVPQSSFICFLRRTIPMLASVDAVRRACDAKRRKAVCRFPDGASLPSNNWAPQTSPGFAVPLFYLRGMAHPYTQKSPQGKPAPPCCFCLKWRTREGATPPPPRPWSGTSPPKCAPRRPYLWYSNRGAFFPRFRAVARE